MAEREKSPDENLSPLRLGHQKGNGKRVTQLKERFESSDVSQKHPAPPVKPKPVTKRTLPTPFTRKEPQTTEVEVSHVTQRSDEEGQKVQDTQQAIGTEPLDTLPGLPPDQPAVPEILTEDLKSAQDQVFASHIDKIGLDPDKTGLEPDKTGLEPDKTGLEPDKTGLEPDKTGLDEDETGTEIEDSTDAADTVVCRNIASEKTTSLIKKRSAFIGTIEEQETDHSDDARSEQVVRRSTLQRQDEMDGLIDSGNGGSVAGDILDEETFNSDFEDDLDGGPTKFEEGRAKVLSPEGQEEETFSDWLEKIKDKGTWRQSCPVSLDEAMKLDGFSVKDLKKIGTSFNRVIEEQLGSPPELPTRVGRKPVKNPIYLFLGTENTDNWKKIIQVACKSFHGINRDLSAIGNVLEKKQMDKKRMAQELKKCLIKFKETLDNMEPDVVKLLALGDDTFEGLIEHKKLLDEHTCPIVVAGQVSSGKTSLLNLFLGAGCRKEEQDQPEMTASSPLKTFTLPVSTLACTGRVCEISYGNSRTAMVRHVKTGKTSEISINKLEAHVDMFNQDDSFKDEDHINDIVQVGLPIPYLKGGITLVDTPGVGENQTDSEVVKHYVKANNVFGFIFTIHTSAGSGVNQKFQQLLTELSTYKDSYGNKKLDPESVIFVCNFWDQIKEADRHSTKERVISILQQTGFMKDFDPEKQLFFMNSKGAFETWKIGFISEDYDRLIGGMERFFEIGHKKKIMQSYCWLNSVVQRVMRSMKFIQVWARELDQDSMKHMFRGLDHRLDSIDGRYDRLVKSLRNMLPKAAGNLAKQLLKSLDTQTFSKPDFSLTEEDKLYLESFEHNPEQQEYKVDEMVDTRISSMFSRWEAQNNPIHKVKVKLVSSITKNTDNFDTWLDEFERQTLSAEQSTETPGSPFANPSSDETKHNLEKSKVGSLEDTPFNISFGRTYGEEIFRGADISKRASLAGNCVIVNFAKRSRTIGQMAKQPFRQGLAKFNKTIGFKAYVKHRADVIFTEMCNKESLKHTMLRYLEPVEQLLDTVEAATKARIHQNRQLISMINTRMITAVGTQEKRAAFFHASDQMSSMFNRILQLGYETGVEEVLFTVNNLSIDYNSTRKTTTTCGQLMPGVVTGETLKVDAGSKSRGLVSVQLLKGFLMESEQLELVKHLRKLSGDVLPRCLPVVLGLCEGGYGVVMDGDLITLRHYFSSTSLEDSHYRHRVVTCFRYLADALIFLHSKDLVTGEMSLDTVVMQVMETEKIGPLFTNIREKGPIRLPVETKEEGGPPPLTGNYIYLPYEVVQAPFTAKPQDKVDRWYSSPGDMYGLGVMLLELYLRQNFLERLKNTPFKSWSEKSDPGQSVMQECMKSRMDVPDEWLDICRDCLRVQAKERPTARAFKSVWEKSIVPKYPKVEDKDPD